MSSRISTRDGLHLSNRGGIQKSVSVQAAYTLNGPMRLNRTRPSAARVETRDQKLNVLLNSTMRGGRMAVGRRNVAPARMFTVVAVLRFIVL